MAKTPDVSFSVLGIAPAPAGKAYVLFNRFEMPIDPEFVESVIQEYHIAETRLVGKTKMDAQEWLTAISSNAAGHVHGCSMDGNVHRFDGSRWSVVPTTADSGLNDVFTAADGSAFAVGMEGEIVAVSAARAQVVVNGGAGRLNAVHGCASDCVYAAGDDGRMLRFDGAAWTEIAPLTNVNLLAVHCVTPDSVYVGGASGTVFRWDGNDWHDIDAEQGIVISAFANYRGRIYVAGGVDGFFEIESGALRQLKKSAVTSLAVCGDVLFAGANKVLAYFDGQRLNGGTLALW